MQAAEKGMADGWIRAGMLLEEGGRHLRKDWQKARECYEKAVAQGNARGSALLGLLYERGQGVATDLEMAKQCYRRAANSDQFGLIKLAQLLRAEAQSPQAMQEIAWWMGHARERQWHEAWTALCG
jgi:TPR repeat protein